MKAAILALLLLSGCATAQVEVVKKDGSTCRASYVSFAKDLSGVKLAACHEARGSADNSATDNLLFEMLVEVIKKGLSK